MTRKTMEFKIKAIKLSDDIGLRSAAKKKKVGLSTLSKWKKEIKTPKVETNFTGPNNHDLIRKHKELEMKNQILMNMLKDELRA